MPAIDEGAATIKHVVNSPPAAIRDSRRAPALEGGHNFRDLGGYCAADGRRVRWGRIYRSGALDALTQNDYRHLAALGIRTIFDLRSNRERVVVPIVLPKDIGVEYWARDHEGSAGDLIAQMARQGTTDVDMRARMMAAYRRLPYEQAPGYRELFHRVADGALPLVFACAAGKDRTGIAAALLLDAVGVPRETVIEDYLLSEVFFDSLCRKLLARSARRLSGVSPSVWEPVLRADRAYIETAFAQIIQRDGSVENYLATHIHLDSLQLSRLRQQLLE